MSRPVVLIPARRTPRGPRLIDYVGELHLELLIRLKILPVMVPVAPGVMACIGQYAKEMSGLLLVEGEDIEPKRYRATAANRRYLEKTHPLKDQIELYLLRLALRRKLPILGICRGSQLLNVACGGTLYGDVQKEKKSPLKHIYPQRYDAHRHTITIIHGTPLRKWYGRNRIGVNSYHHQGVRDLARRFSPMAHADDGLIEAFYDPSKEFTVGLQFHPERMLSEHRGNQRIWDAFGAAVRHRARSSN
jgi:putative glutamine amidotransferase